MNEKFGPDIYNDKLDSDREVRQVTHRSYESYLNLFNLPKDSLAKIGTVVDIGAGFSNFSEEAHKNFSHLRALAVDPVYKLIKTNPNLTPGQLEKQDRVRLDFDPSYRDEETTTDLDSYQIEETKIFDHFVEEVKKHPRDYVDASHQNLPFGNKSADLVLASNSIIRSENKPPVFKNIERER